VVGARVRGGQRCMTGLSFLHEARLRAQHVDRVGPGLHAVRDAVDPGPARGAVPECDPEPLGHLGRCRPEDWSLNLTVFFEGRPVGLQSMFAKDFGIARTVDTGPGCRSRCTAGESAPFPVKSAC
jgi:hypothetical protein